MEFQGLALSLFIRSLFLSYHELPILHLKNIIVPLSHGEESIDLQNGLIYR